MVKTKIAVFGEISGGSVYLVNKAIEKYLAEDFEFRYINWHAWSLQDLSEIYEWCDVFFSCLSAHDMILNSTKGLGPEKPILLITHDPNEHTVVQEYSKRFSYAQTCLCDRSLFPKDTIVHLMMNGVDSDNFSYKPRDGTLKQMGWVGRLACEIKQPEWAKLISLVSRVPLVIRDGAQPVKPVSYMREWYQSVDLLIVTAVPEWTSETGPLPPFEAIVSGIPAIGTPVGNFRDVPGPKFTTIDEAVTIVKELCDNPETMKALALEQYRYVLTHNTYAILADSWRAGFNAALTRSSFQN